MDEEIKVTPVNNGVEVKLEAPAEPDPISYLPIQGMLGVEEPTAEDKSALQEVWQYFNPDGKKSDVEVMYAIRGIESRLEPPRMGETRLNKVYQYIKLKRDIESNERLLKLL